MNTQNKTNQTTQCTCNIVHYADGTIRNHCLIHLEARLHNYLNEKINLNKRKTAILESSSGMILGGLEKAEIDEKLLEVRYSIDKLDQIKLRKYLTFINQYQSKSHQGRSVP